jgi:hypothetical protein
MSVAVLAVRIEAESARFRRQMLDASNSVRSFGTSVDRIYGGVRNLAALLGAGFGAYKAVDAFRRTAHEMEQILDVAETFGLATESVARLKYAADKNYASFEALTKAIAFQQRSLRAARDGAAEAGRTYQRLGIDIDRLASMRPEDAFLEVAEALKNTIDPATRTQSMFRLFGRNAIEIADTVLLGADGLRQMFAEADRLGLTFDAGIGHSVNAMNESLRSMQGAFSGMARTVVSELAPVVTGAADAFVEFMTGGEGMAERMRGWIDAVIDRTIVLEKSLRSIMSAVDGINSAFATVSRAADVIGAVKDVGIGSLFGLGSGIVGAAGSVTSWFGNLIGSDALRAAGAQLDDDMKTFMYTTQAAMENANRRMRKITGSGNGGGTDIRPVSADELLNGVKSSIAAWREAGERRIAEANTDAAIMDVARQSTMLMQEEFDAAERRMNELRMNAERLTRETRTPAEVFADTQRDLNEMLDEGLISWETYARAMERAAREMEGVADATDATRRSISAMAGSGDLDKVAFAFGGVDRGGATAQDARWIRDPLETPIGGWNPIALADAVRGKAAHDYAFARASHFIPGAQSEMALAGARLMSSTTGMRIEQLDTTNEYLRMIANAISTRTMMVVAV